AIVSTWNVHMTLAGNPAPSKTWTVSVWAPSLRENGSDHRSVVSLKVPKNEKSVPSTAIIASTMPAEIWGSTYDTMIRAEASFVDEPSVGVVDKMTGGLASNRAKSASASTASDQAGPAAMIPTYNRRKVPEQF